jgi:hypothetical protein
MHRFARTAAVSIAALVVMSCSSNSDPAVQANGETPSTDAGAPSTAGGDEDAANAAVPGDCSDLETAAVADMLGGTPVLDPDSEFNTTLEQLHCIWNTEEAVTEKVSVQLGVADDFIGFYGSQEGTGISEFTEVDGFDEGRLYGEEILIAKRNGFAVAVDARSVFPTPTTDQIIAVALEATG